jgi:SAM-dependent methyltransferase
VDSVFVTSSEPGFDETFFDSEHENMRAGQADWGTSEVFYRRQVNTLLSTISSGMKIVDLGCGPALPYSPPEGSYVVGVDPSLLSLRKNKDVNLRIQATAQRLPIRTGVADVVVCFYSIHHMTGQRIADNERFVRGAVREMKRILKDEGALLIFEVNPIPLARLMQKGFWNLGKRMLRRNLDAYFWGVAELPGVIRSEWPDSQVSRQEYESPPFTMFPPVISFPWLRMPRALYPFSISGFRVTNG